MCFAVIVTCTVLVVLKLKHLPGDIVSRYHYEGTDKEHPQPPLLVTAFHRTYYDRHICQCLPGKPGE